MLTRLQQKYIVQQYNVRQNYMTRSKIPSKRNAVRSKNVIMRNCVQNSRSSEDCLSKKLAVCFFVATAARAAATISWEVALFGSKRLLMAWQLLYTTYSAVIRSTQLLLLLVPRCLLQSSPTYDLCFSLAEFHSLEHLSKTFPLASRTPARFGKIMITQKNYIK